MRCWGNRNTRIPSSWCVPRCRWIPGFAKALQTFGICFARAAYYGHMSNHPRKGIAMNKKNLGITAVALALGLSSLSAFAEPGRQHGPQGHGPSQHMQKGPPGPQGHPGPQVHRPGPAPHMQGGPAARPVHPHGIPPGQAKRMGAGPNHNWVKGGRVPPQYRGYQYVVNDWRGHGLRQPPRGHQWVQYGGDYLLVAIATGVIAQLILGN